MVAPKSACKNELFIAIEHGDQDTVDAIIQTYPELVNIRAINGWTPLMFASRYGQLDICKSLIEKGNASLDKNPLKAAEQSQFWSYTTLKYLLEKGASPNAQGLLAQAAHLKLRDVISLFLAYGAVYDQTYEYIDRVTKQHVCQVVRYNDKSQQVPDKFILSCVMMPTPPSLQQPTMAGIAGASNSNVGAAGGNTNNEAQPQEQIESTEATEQMQRQFQQQQQAYNERQRMIQVTREQNNGRRELLNIINYSKCEGLIQLYQFNKLDQNIDLEDMRQILKYM